jgi:hypothetical protein
MIVVGLLLLASCSSSNSEPAGGTAVDAGQEASDDLAARCVDDGVCNNSEHCSCADCLFRCLDCNLEPDGICEPEWENCNCPDCAGAEPCVLPGEGKLGDRCLTEWAPWCDGLRQASGREPLCILGPDFVSPGPQSVCALRCGSVEQEQQCHELGGQCYHDFMGGSWFCMAEDPGSEMVFSDCTGPENDTPCDDVCKAMGLMCNHLSAYAYEGCLGGQLSSTSCNVSPAALWASKGEPYNYFRCQCIGK